MSRIKANVRSGELNGRLDMIPMLTIQRTMALNALRDADAITDAKEKAAFVLGFRKQLIQMEKALLDMETAALDGKTDEAKKIYNDTIKPMKKEGHARYKG